MAVSVLEGIADENSQTQPKRGETSEQPGGRAFQPASTGGRLSNPHQQEAGKTPAPLFVSFILFVPSYSGVIQLLPSTIL